MHVFYTVAGLLVVTKLDLALASFNLLLDCYTFVGSKQLVVLG